MSFSKYRNMRLILLFDLPAVESGEKKEYLFFKKGLILNGYTMMQFSVYVKSINTQTKIKQEINKIIKYVPSNGNIRLISITEKQYEEMEMILGHKKINEIYNNDKRYVKI